MEDLDSKNLEAVEKLLLAQFNDIVEESGLDSKNQAEKKIVDMQLLMVSVLPNLEEEVLLNCIFYFNLVYNCSYLNDEVPQRGNLFITRNYLCFYSLKSNTTSNLSICIPFKDFLSVELALSKRLLQQDNLLIKIKDKSVFYINPVTI